MSGHIYITDLQRVEPGGLARTVPPAANEMLLITSSAEIGILGSPEARRLIQRLLPISTQEKRILLSIGCVGLFACVLEFAHGSAPTAKVLVLETPATTVQLTLDAAGIGSGADGFVAQDVAYLVTLAREPCRGALAIHHCAILAREASIAGTSKLASRLISTIASVLTRVSGHPGCDLLRIVLVGRVGSRH